MANVYEKFNFAGPATLTHDGEVKATVESADAAFAWLLRHTGQSVAYAIRHGGWKVRPATKEEADASAS